MVSKKIKKILIIISPILLIVCIFFLLFYFGLHVTTPPPDLKRMGDIHVIRGAMEVYFDKHGSRYFQSPMSPISIGEYVIPKDPKGVPYGWISNISESQKFCVFAKLETKDVYYVASHCGAKESNRQPVSLDECCELSKP